MYIELAHAANKVVTELVEVKKSNRVVILAESICDRTAVDAMAEAVYAVGGFPIVIWYPTAVDVVVEPPEPIAQALKSCDVVIEFSLMYILHTAAFDAALSRGVKWQCLTGLDAKAMVEVIGKADNKKLDRFGSNFRGFLDRTAGSQVKVTSRAGTDVTFVYQKGIQDQSIPCPPRDRATLPGQTGGHPVLGSTNGRIVFDGSMWPPKDLGILANPIELIVKNGRIEEIKGGKEARILEKWLSDLKDPEMYYPAHIHVGFHPQCKQIGVPLVDERIFGCICVGIGWWTNGKPGHRPKSVKHTDGEMLNVSMWVGSEQVLEGGRFVHPELRELGEELLKTRA